MNPEEMKLSELLPFVREYGRRLRRKQGKGPLRAKVLRPCPHCEQVFGTRELKEHKPICPQRQRKRAEQQ